MILKIKTTNIELTEDIQNYINKKLEGLDKLLIEDTDPTIYVEVAKTTNHHNKGDLFKAEFNLISGGDKFFTSSKKEILFNAIDEAGDDLFRRVTSKNKKEQTLFRRGAKSIKKMLKGLSKRNPFTGKY